MDRRDRAGKSMEARTEKEFRSVGAEIVEEVRADGASGAVFIELW